MSAALRLRGLALVAALALAPVVAPGGATGATAATSCEAGAPAPTVSVPGQVVVRDGFETGDLRQWDDQGLSGDGWAGVTPTAARDGGCGAYVHVTDHSGSRAYLLKRLHGARSLWADGWFSVRSEGHWGNNVPFWRAFDRRGWRQVDVYRSNGSGELWMRTADGAGGYVYTRLGPVVSLGSWHHLVVHARGRGGRVSVWWDGQRVAHLSGLPLSRRFSTIQAQAEHYQQQGDLVLDDAVITVRGRRG